MAVSYTWDHIEQIRNHPHIIGHLGNKTLLTEMHSDWIRYIWDTDQDRALQGHRGSYKSTAIIECGVPWYLMWHPEHRVAIVRKTYTAAAEVVRSIANLMESPLVRPVFEKVWGSKWRFDVKREGKLNLSVKTTSTPQSSIEALGLDSNITGKHYDRVILDDFIDLNDRISEAEREKTKLLVQEIRANIIDRGNPTSFIGTPWHKQDAWTILPPSLKYPLEKTGLITADQEKKIRETTTPILFACNYDLKFEAEDDLIFRNPYIGKWHFDQVTNVKAQIDAAFKGDHWNAMTIMGNLPNGRLNAIGFAFHGNIKEWLGFIAMKMIQYGATQFFMEENADKGYSADVLTMHPDIKRQGIWADTYHEAMNKHVKISTYLYESWREIEWAQETDPMYLEMCTDYREKQEPDDCPDSCASLLREGGFSKTKDYLNSGIWDY
jgi:hypothetical protein